MKLITNLSAIQKSLFFGIGFVLFAGLVLFINWFFDLPVKQADAISSKLEYTGQQIRLLKTAMNGAGEDQLTATLNQVRHDIEYYQALPVVKHHEDLKLILNDQLAALNSFEENLKDLAMGNHERGNEHDGLISRWHELSVRIARDAENNSPEIKRMTEKIRHDEMDYLLHGNFSTCESILVTIAETRSKLQEKEAGIKPSDLDAYSTLTSSLLALDKRIGTAALTRTGQSLDVLIAVSDSAISQIKAVLNRNKLDWKISLYVVLALLTAGGIIMLILITNRYITRPLSFTTSYIERVARGELPDALLEQSGLPEIRMIDGSINRIMLEMNKKTEFMRSLNSNNLEAVLEPAGPHDLLSAEMNALRQLIADTAVGQQKNEEENARRRYINEGLARFSEILRTQSNDTIKLGDAFIREIVKYLNAIQGGFFLMNENNGQEPALDLISSFAYNRKKYMQRSLLPGEGLVGTCAREKQIINLTEIPEGYISITSGLGDAKPDNLLLVPVTHEEELIGVLEIASLHRYLDHEIEFARQVSDSLGSTIVYTRNNQRTTALLQKTQQQALEMSEQEEEMRQNMEELKATQEESMRREEEFRGIAEAIDNTMMVIKYDTGGFIREVNEKCCVFLGLPMEDIVGKDHRSAFEGTIDPDGLFWNDLQKKGVMMRSEKVKIGKKIHHLKEHFAVVSNKDGNIVQYVSFITETTE